MPGLSSDESDPLLRLSCDPPDLPPLRGCRSKRRSGLMSAVLAFTLISPLHHPQRGIGHAPQLQNPSSSDQPTTSGTVRVPPNTQPKPSGNIKGDPCAKYSHQIICTIPLVPPRLRIAIVIVTDGPRTPLRDSRSRECGTKPLRPLNPITDNPTTSRATPKNHCLRYGGDD